MPARITVVFICNDLPSRDWVFCSTGWFKGEEPYFFTPEGICLNGHDISQQLKRYPDDKITGAFSLGKGDGSLFFVSVYSEDNYHGRVILLSDTDKGAGYVVIYQNQRH
ncbi:hypothetical protein EAN92_10890 [Klebsiella pneumoniae]|nr:hypothetical protein EAN92_10890 [Klebsiella pneumoniae]